MSKIVKVSLSLSTLFIYMVRLLDRLVWPGQTNAINKLYVDRMVSNGHSMERFGGSRQLRSA